MAIQKLLKNKFLLLTLFFSIVFASNAQQNYTFGALAIDSPQGDRWGFSYNQPNAKAAETRALKECGSSCSIVVRFDKGCAAYAASQRNGSTVYGWGKSAGAAEAKNIALSECNAREGECIIRTWACSSQ